MKRDMQLKSWAVRLLILLPLMTLTACSKTVQWEEEVPLNTGEVIWVKRSGTYSFGYSAGYGYVGYSPDWKSTIAFTYKGKKYRHTDDAFRVMLAIAPDGRPNLFTRSFDWGNRHGYPCDGPGYVQFMPPVDGGRWTWPKFIEPWAYGLPTNLIGDLVPLESDGMRMTIADRRMHTASNRNKHDQEIDPGFKDKYCVRSN